MCDQEAAGQQTPPADIMDFENFKSYYVRSVVGNSQYKQCKSEETPLKIVDKNSGKVSEIVEEVAICESSKLKPFQAQDAPIRYRKNTRSASMDDSRRYSCGSILSRRNSLISTPKRGEIPVENIYNQSKIETLQWQLREIEKSRNMYKAVMKQIVVFLGKAHTSLEHLGIRLNRKSSVCKSKSEHHIERESSITTSEQRALVEEHLSSWTPNKKPDLHPDEIPPEKLSQEAFRLLRTALSLLNMQEPNLSSSESVNIPEEPSDIEFLAQLAKEFPSDGQRPTSFSVSPKLILPENDLKISKAFNRKLSLQLNDTRRNSKFDVARASIAEAECYSLPLGGGNVDPLRPLENNARESPVKNLEKAPGSPATASISSTEDESGFSSMNSFQDVGLPLTNSTAIEGVSARTVLLKSMLHNNDSSSLLNSTFDQNNSMIDTTLTSISRGSTRSSIRRYDHTKERRFNNNKFTEEELKKCCENDAKLWQKPADAQTDLKKESKMAMMNTGEFGSPLTQKRWSSTSDQKANTAPLKVLWV